MNINRFSFLRKAANLALGLGTVVVMLFSAVSPAYAASVHVDSVGVGGPSGTVTYGTGGTVSYTVTVHCTGTGTGITVTPQVTAGLPSGTTWDFSPSTLTWGNGCGSAANPQTPTLNLHTSDATPGGVSVFSVAAGGVTGTGSLTVNGIHLTVTGFAADNKQYDGNTVAVADTSGVLLSGPVASGDDVHLDSSSVSASFADEFIGTFKVVTAAGFGLTGTDAHNYSITQPTTHANITKRDLHIYINTVSDKVYDGTDAATVTFSDDRVVGDSLTVSGTATFPSKNAGDNLLVTVPSANVTGTDAGNYNVVTSTATALANISKRGLTVTAATDTKQYDNSTSSSATPLITGAIQTGDSAGFTQSFDTKDVGSGKTLTPTGAVSDGNSGNNYDVTFVPVTTGVINPRTITTVTADNKTIAFGDSDPAFTFTYALGDLAPGEDASVIDVKPVCSVSGDHSAAGDYPIVCSGGSDPSYDFSTTNYVNGTLTRTASPIVVTPFNSVGLYDGWILESGEFTNAGGTKNNKATTLRVGDDALNKQYKSILSFDTSSLPDALTIQQVTLKVRQQKIVGTPAIFTKLKGLTVDVMEPSFKLLKLQLGDFRVKPTVFTGKMAAGMFGATPDGSGWYSVDLTSASQFISRTSTTQFRLRFVKDDNNNFAANYLSLFSGNAPDAPQLVITYTVP